jgi:hypothetical protein
MTPAQRETIADAAAMLDGLALELRRAHAFPPAYLVIPDPEVAKEEMHIKRVVAKLYAISRGVA